jgi:feruloyl esterase
MTNGSCRQLHSGRDLATGRDACGERLSARLQGASLHRGGINACDANDGITDGVISDPAQCQWNPDQLVGLQTPCGVITRTDAEVVKKILQGPVTTTGKSLWFGLEPGAGMTTLAGTTTDANGVTTANPQFLTLIYHDTWLHPNDPSWTWQELTYANFQQSVATFDNVIGTRKPDLSAFKAHGGKILIWHGFADPLIFAQGTINYCQRVQVMGGVRGTDSFARLFLAPGAGHCGSATGPAPANPLGDLVK